MDTLPDWLTAGDPPKLPTSNEAKELAVAQFSVVLPRVLEAIYEGCTLDNALRALPIHVPTGAFMRWLKKNPKYFELYKEAKEIRTEAWAGKIIEHAVAEDNPLEDVARSRLIVDTYKWLMQSDNRKQYGDVKQVEFGGNISITAALEQARGRVIEMAVDEVPLLVETDQTDPDEDTF